MQVRPEEVIIVEELEQAPNNSSIFKDNTWNIDWATFWAAGTVLTSNWPTSNPTFQPWWGWWSWDVTWPWSSTDNAVSRFDWTTWKIIQNSSVTIDDWGVVVWSTISWNSNTFSAIPTSAAAQTTGLDSAFATGTPWVSGNAAQWNADWDLLILEVQ